MKNLSEDMSGIDWHRVWCHYARYGILARLPPRFLNALTGKDLVAGGRESILAEGLNGICAGDFPVELLVQDSTSYQAAVAIVVEHIETQNELLGRMRTREPGWKERVSNIAAANKFGKCLARAYIERHRTNRGIVGEADGRFPRKSEAERSE